MTGRNEDLFEDLKEALEEVRAHKEGRLALTAREINPMPPEVIRMIYKGVSKSVRDFEEQFMIPKATMDNWLQGRRKPGPGDRAYLRVIEKNPEAVRAALKAG